MQRFVTEIPIGENRVRFKTVIRDIPTAKGSEDARMRQYQFLRELGDSFSVLACGMQMFESLKIYHDGNSWVAEAEATAEALNA